IIAALACRWLLWVDMPHVEANPRLESIQCATKRPRLRMTDQRGSAARVGRKAEGERFRMVAHYAALAVMRRRMSCRVAFSCGTLSTPPGPAGLRALLYSCVYSLAS